jgi:hypothetical protein
MLILVGLRWLLTQPSVDALIALTPGVAWMTVWVFMLLRSRLRCHAGNLLAGLALCDLLALPVLHGLSDVRLPASTLQLPPLGAAEAWAGWRVGVYAVCVLAVLALLLRAPLPESYFPVRGTWLRRYLAVLALGGMGLTSGAFIFAATLLSRSGMLWTARVRPSLGLLGSSSRVEAIQLSLGVLLAAIGLVALWRLLAVGGFSRLGEALWGSARGVQAGVPKPQHDGAA